MMSLRKDDNAQMYTIEGIAAAIILIMGVVFMLNSNSYVTLQPDKTADMKLTIIANDALTVLDSEDNNHPSELKRYIAEWNGGEASMPDRVNTGEASIIKLDTSLNALILGNMGYNVVLKYYDGSNIVSKDVILSGSPEGNSISTSKLITINDHDKDEITVSAYWDPIPKPVVVEVKLIIWYI